VEKAVAGNAKVSRTLAARVTAKFMESRRRLGTVAAFAIAGLLAYHVVVGANGLNVYKQKMAEDKQLAAEVKELQQQNDQLKKHVDHLASDPDAIEYEAHMRLRYTRPGQVIVLNDAAPASATK
jgi:cell division protein FtsB